MKKNTTINFSTNTGRSIRVKDFMNTAFKTFSLHDNVRSIPALTDGLKVSQRKAIFGTLTRGENADEVQVERLSAQIAQCSDYHHGAGSMAGTIVGMAADKFPGSNNMNVFMPTGQFGSRLTKEAGAGRYIFTQLSPYFRQLFKKEDDIILDHIYVDGQKIEPKTYFPILPFSLVNGAQGTGTGHACNVLSYHPNELRDAILKVLSGKVLIENTLTPFFQGFTGSVERNQVNGQVIITGKLEVINTTTINITELPVGVFLDTYKEHLNKLEEQGFIKDYDDASTEASFKFIVKVPRATTELTETELYTKFKLISRDTENFTHWDTDGNLKRFESAEAVIQAFVPWRIDQYENRRETLIKDVTENIRLLSETIRFIKFYLANTKLFRDTGKKDLIALMLENKFSDYDKLLSMQIWVLTKDRIEELNKKLDDMKLNLSTLQSDSAIEMYKRELKKFNYDK